MRPCLAAKPWGLEPHPRGVNRARLILLSLKARGRLDGQTCRGWRSMIPPPAPISRGNIRPTTFLSKLYNYCVNGHKTILCATPMDYHIHTLKNGLRGGLPPPQIKTRVGAPPPAKTKKTPPPCYLSGRPGGGDPGGVCFWGGGERVRLA